MNEIKIFENKELGIKARTILNPDGGISISAEDTAFGFGWTQTQNKNGKKYTSIRWETLNDYCKDFGFPNKLGKDDYIPESLFYMLGMKASNEKALKYQQWLAIDVLPSIRKTGSYEIPKKKQVKPKKENLSSVNMMVKNLSGVLNDAGVDKKFIAAEVTRIYSENGYEVKVPLISDMPALWDYTHIAKELGVLSKTGKPHDKAVSAIIQKLDISESETVKTAYSRNGHDGVTVQYTDSVFTKVKQWLIKNGYPLEIPYTLSNGNVKKCKVIYQENTGCQN